MISIRENIIADIKTQCETITTANGYDTDVRLVERSRTSPFTDELFPAIFIYEDTDSLTQPMCDIRSRRTMTLVLECWIKATYDRSVEVNKFYADVQKAILTDTQRSLNAISTIISSSEFVVGDNNLAGISVGLDIVYQIISDSPNLLG